LVRWPPTFSASLSSPSSMARFVAICERVTHDPSWCKRRLLAQHVAGAGFSRRRTLSAVGGRHRWGRAVGAISAVASQQSVAADECPRSLRSFFRAPLHTARLVRSTHRETPPNDPKLQGSNRKPLPSPMGRTHRDFRSLRAALRFVQ
jgi:hypothetical protein